MKTTHGIAGIDGCPGGWFVATRPPGSSEVRCFLAPDIGGVINGLEGIDVIGVDMPVGIPDRDMRECDQLARKRLSPYRTSSVFSSPIRPVLGIGDYRITVSVDPASSEIAIGSITSI